jgi:hypothetical protein
VSQKDQLSQMRQALNAESEKVRGAERAYDEMRELTRRLAEFLGDSRQRVVDGRPCWCFLWPDEDPHCEAPTNTWCRDAQELWREAEKAGVKP